jgi:hypothetical protein
MPRDFTDEATAGMLAESTEKIYLVLMTITQADMPINPLRLVANNEDITSNGALFNACGFRYVSPGDGAKEFPRGSLEVDNTDQSITDALLSISTPAAVKMEVVLYNPAGDSDEVVQSIEGLSVRNFQNDLVNVRAPLLFDDIFSQRIPADVYDPVQNSGLFE